MTTSDYPGFEPMREIGALTAQCLDELHGFIIPGVTTELIDQYVHVFQLAYNLENAQKGYSFNNTRTPFPGYCCTSVNHVICHGIPSSKKLKEGDIVKVDITFIKNGWHGDACRTYEVGKCGVKATKVSDVAKTALYLGISEAIAGKTVGDIAKKISDYVESINMSVVEDHYGHGIGLKFHQPPFIPHWRLPHSRLHDVVLKPGMMFTIEPMVNFGRKDYKTLGDGWTVVSRDMSLSAQWEHTIGITDNFPVIFTMGIK